ncbi:hypothetical protein Rumeso_00006 [Rubellimicrobium mesophilum DSM 19309]|uniref:D-glutamate cyclase-like C-terminal domain-containing protein n=1 Tax=Rubellimicrobium mesophilum DSM 19309 TaxID=442562 RepID=A0A017HVP0_9RHOB|nr:glutamate cyclase domain-containing protein [Rubellimicrobium mesophilum]EYD78395.1 hypothetical protein Rumeso_00006 [Rubellimicrobium mesophilum DSM 19309]
MPDIMGEYVDRLVTVEMRNRGMNYGIVRQIYDAARAEGGGRPISARAAEALVGAVKPGDVVFIVTGAGYYPEVPNGESDGPPGAASLARAIYWGLKAIPVFVTEECHAPPVVASAKAAAVMVRDFELAKTRRMGGALITAPEDRSITADWAERIVTEYNPKAVIAIERLGPNDQGFVHGSTGVRKDCVDLGHVFLAAQRRNILTVGVGDNGNEIGFGRIYDFMRDFHPYGRECQYEGGTGVITTIATDVFLPASISNWGAYGITAMIGFLLNNREVLQTPEMERKILEACLDAGGWEMRYCTSRFIVDGTVGESSMSIVQLLGDMLRLNLAEPDRGLSHGVMKTAKVPEAAE